MDKSPDNIKFTSQISFCPYALSFDLYKGCSHHCAYCFAQTTHGETLNVGHRNKVALFAFDKIIKYINGDENLKNTYIFEYVKKMQPFHIGGMADPFPYKIEDKVHHALSFIRKVGTYPCIWSTKNPPAENDYTKEIEKGNHIFQFSCIGNPKYDDRIKRIEPGLPNFETRFENLKILKKSSKKIVIRLQPFIPFLWTYETLNKFFDKISKVADAVSIEFLKKPVAEKWTKFSEIIGFDISGFFDKCGTIDMGFDKVFDTLYRYELLKLLKKMIKARGMEFYSAENYFRHLSDAPACCGISEKDDPIFQSKLTYSLNHMLFKAKNEGSFCWDDIEENMSEKLKKGKWVTGFDQKLAKLTIERILKYRYKPGNTLSPSRIFCNLEPKLIEGKIHYVYAEKKFDRGFDLYLEKYDKDYGNSILKDAKII